MGTISFRESNEKWDLGKAIFNRRHCPADALR